MGRALGVAAGPDSVTFFSKAKPKKEEKKKKKKKKKKFLFFFPLKMLPTLIWYFTEAIAEIRC